MNLFNSAKTLPGSLFDHEPVAVKLVIVPDGMVSESSTLYLTIKHLAQEVVSAATAATGNISIQAFEKVLQEHLKESLNLTFPEIMTCESPMDFSSGNRQLLVGVRVTPELLAEYDARDNLTDLLRDVFG